MFCPLRLLILCVLLQGSKCLSFQDELVQHPQSGLEVSKNVSAILSSLASLWPQDELETEEIQMMDCKNREKCLQAFHDFCLRGGEKPPKAPGYHPFCSRRGNFFVSVVTQGLSTVNIRRSSIPLTAIITGLGNTRTIPRNFMLTRSDNQIRFSLTTNNPLPRATYFDAVIEGKERQNLNCLVLSATGQSVASTNGTFGVIFTGFCP